MARITVEDCLKKEINRFALVLLAAKRAKQLLTGSKALTSDARSNKSIVTALREIADGKVRFMTPEEAQAAKEAAARLEAEQAEKAAVVQEVSPTAALENAFHKPTEEIAEKAPIEDVDDDDDDDEGLDIPEEEGDDDDDDESDEESDDSSEGPDSSEEK